MIKCKKLFNRAANQHRQTGIQDRILLEDEDRMTHEKKKFFTKEEGIAFFSWCLHEWKKYFKDFIDASSREEPDTESIDSDKDDDEKEEEEEEKENEEEDEEEEEAENDKAMTRNQKAMHLQEVLMGMMLYLGGGLRKQVFVDLLADNLQWNGDEMVMKVGRKKVARVNTSILPVPRQLANYIEFFKQKVRPVLFQGNPENPPLAMWLDSKGQPLSSSKWTDHFKRLLHQFNPELTTSPIDFRRMTVTDLFAERFAMEDNETMEHFHARFGDFLNVSVNVMKHHYNRHKSRESHKKTLATANADRIKPQATSMLNEMEVLMQSQLDQGSKVPLHKLVKRKDRTVSDDEEWEKQSGHKRKAVRAWKWNESRKQRRLTAEQQRELKEAQAEEEEAKAEQEVDEADLALDQKLHEADPNGAYEVEAIVDMRTAPVLVQKRRYYHRGKQGRPKSKKAGNSSEMVWVEVEELQVLVKWKNYPSSANTWEPFVDMTGAMEAMQAYLLKRYYS